MSVWCGVKDNQKEAVMDTEKIFKGLQDEDFASMGEIAMQVNNLIRKRNGQEESHVPIQPDVVKRVIENSDNFCPRKSHENWREARKADGWTGGEYNQKLKTHPNLAVKGWDELPFGEKVKDWTFFASCMAAYFMYVKCAEVFTEALKEVTEEESLEKACE